MKGVWSGYCRHSVLVYTSNLCAVCTSSPHLVYLEPSCKVLNLIWTLLSMTLVELKLLVFYLCELSLSLLLKCMWRVTGCHTGVCSIGSAVCRGGREHRGKVVRVLSKCVVGIRVAGPGEASKATMYIGLELSFSFFLPSF